ncbi:MAG: sel1 repeat family protein [Clostridia bacterium]|nr:sel1 repeat family protein [Clostridia bacterium]
MKCKKCGKSFKISESGLECPRCFEVYSLNEKELSELYNDALAKERKKRFSEAALKFKVAAECGMTDAIYRYGECLEWGRGVKASLPLALEAYERASAMGSADASYAYFCCVTDKKAENEYGDKALYRLRVAAMLGHTGAAYELACLYETGEVIKADTDVAAYWFYLASESGSSDAMLALSAKYAYGRGVEENHEYAKWYLEKAEKDKKKNRRLASMLSRVKASAPKKISLSDMDKRYFELALECELKKELGLSFTFFLRSAELGYEKGMYRAAHCYMSGAGTDKDEKRAVELYSLAAEKGYIDAVVALGNCYRNGRGVEKDDNKCLQCYERAAELGDARATYLLADCYFNGDLCEQDVPKAVRLYQKSALKAYPAAVEKINKIFDSFARAFNTALEAQSKGDYEKAIELYTLAAEMGHRASACNLGYCYQVGEGCRKDMKRAVYYYRIAAEDGSPTAKYNLAICYKQGGGVNVDFKEAERLLLECREGGYEKKVDAILKEMRERKVAKLAQKFYSASCTVYRKGNLDSATRLRVMASKLGSAKAEYLIGCQFEFGDGLPKDISKARLWYDKARKHGFIDPVNSMKQAYLREKRIVEIINKVD